MPLQNISIIFSLFDLFDISFRDSTSGVIILKNTEFLLIEQKIKKFDLLSTRDPYSTLQPAVIRWYYLSNIHILLFFIRISSRCRREWDQISKILSPTYVYGIVKISLLVSLRSRKGGSRARNLARLSALWMEPRHIKMIPVQFSAFHSSRTSRHSINMVFVRLNRAVKSSYYSRTL